MLDKVGPMRTARFLLETPDDTIQQEALAYVLELTEIVATLLEAKE